MATPETEIRKLQPIELCTLAQILNQSDAWKTLMALIPKPEDPNQCLFKHEHFTMIEQAVRQQQRSGAEIFLSEWSTLGKRRPTCRSMLDLLVKAELFRAADYLAVDILKGDAPERPKFGPAAVIDVSDEAFEGLLKEQAAVVNNSDLSEQTSQEPLSWSMHFVEKTAVMAASSHSKEAEDQQKELLDFIKFSETVKSDLIKFSDSKVVVEDLPQQLSDVMISGNDVTKEQTEVPEDYVLQEAKSEDIPLCVRENAFPGRSQQLVPEDYVLQEAKSEDIPLCVRENAFPKRTANSAVMSTSTQDSETATTIDSSCVSESTIASEEVHLPNVSQNVIPVVVLEYNEKDKGETD